MKRIVGLAVGVLLPATLVFSACAEEKKTETSGEKSSSYTVGDAPAAEQPAQKSAPAQKAGKDAAAKASATDTPEKQVAKQAGDKNGGEGNLEIVARLVEIPGTFPPNDLYNYVYIMKYRVMKVLDGKYGEREILVGHYNPLIPRKQIKDQMAKSVEGDVEEFEEGAKHRLTLIKPIDKVWQKAVEDEYFDLDVDKFYALEVYKVK